jgi:hypothetical protein
MKYPAPDGHIIESSPNGPVTYTCPVDWSDGQYVSYESTMSVNGLKQIHILRSVDQGICTFTITEMTAQEIQEYIQNLT